MDSRLNYVDSRLTGENLFYKSITTGCDFDANIFAVCSTNKVVNIKDYIINENVTVIFWEDGTKTVVKKTKEDKFDKRLGLLIGYFQKNCGMSKTKANKFLDNLVVTEKKKKEK